MTELPRDEAPVVVDDARHDDAGQLTALVRASAAYAGEYQAMVVGDTITTDYLDANLVRVARGGDGAARGFYAMLTPGRGEPGEGELDYLFVGDDQQGRGLGRLLFEDMRAQAVRRGLRAVHIVSHPPAEEFYRARGARRVGEVPPRGSITWSRPHLLLTLA
ncbi:acetyltransferase (GNAT) family protein [Saccharopolyspora erythraea NRRL 2338]|uniref:Acetyltransferase n=2 Tax=Saccharopolyspora erythraea TaxID=1836 RepID=A4F6M2_SACEN|nr:GNAT family N-acetyltransferase [Saccharopolyspora erythraea]EQD87293.1 acetyltransferase [Saccharopolyspora erythraea D]PFG93499.1 acetyltransferase (GNAT) family protein [Saccharopolyspora erythraea NRRL 2338]QRK90361.1 GNAT family N-acetyltransferase [Saccharopolyspora erythraea]CAL99696.1 acetyltransferase [Saccharopolyspora erythraea NRRL 2338]